jgi:HAD superfamily hydrolase (TIGR01509 family)
MRIHQDTPDALLFDFDGVLADTERIHHASWNEALKPLGIQLSWPEYMKFCVGVADAHVAHKLNLPEPEAYVACKQARFRQMLEQHPPFLPETLELLSELAGRFPLAVVSSSFRTEIFPALERAGLEPYFHTFVFGNDVRNLKPAPEPYLLAVKRLGARRPLAIEDSPVGIASGEAAGCEVLRVRSPQDMPWQLRERLGWS